MSFKDVIAAYKIKAGSAANKAVLISLAKFANKDDHQAWPKISTIAAETELSASTVKRCLSKLAKRGLIERKARYGHCGRMPDTYTLTLEPRCHGDNLAENGGCHGDLGGCPGDPGECHGDTPNSNRTINEPSLAIGKREYLLESSTKADSAANDLSIPDFLRRVMPTAHIIASTAPPEAVAS